MSQTVTDVQTGLTLALPQGWHQIAHQAFPLVLIDQHPGARKTFVPNIVATVVPLLADDDINSFTERNTLAWGEQSSGSVVHVGTAPTDAHDGREVFSLYSEGSRGVAVHTLLFAENGLGTRIDASFRVWDAPEGVTLAPYLLDKLTLPHSAPHTQLNEAQLLSFMQEVARG